MPLYEYQCSDCRKVSETLRPMSKADDPMRCAYCGSERTRRALSVFATVGSGGASSSTSSGCGGCSGGHCSSCGGH